MSSDHEKIVNQARQWILLRRTIQEVPSDSGAVRQFLKLNIPGIEKGVRRKIIESSRFIAPFFEQNKPLADTPDPKTRALLTRDFLESCLIDCGPRASRKKFGQGTFTFAANLDAFLGSIMVLEPLSLLEEPASAGFENMLPVFGRFFAQEKDLEQIGRQFLRLSRVHSEPDGKRLVAFSRSIIESKAAQPSSSLARFHYSSIIAASSKMTQSLYESVFALSGEFEGY